MSYLITWMVLFTDLLFLAFSLYAIYLIFITPSIFFKFVIFILVLGSYKIWKKEGGLLTWSKKSREKFHKFMNGG